ncbi:MAG TPA: GNAT family N-acetyltransferase [Planosporangium sp.]|nr:GNAT family N-acetyltransferase [Planosporangium sp.]
MTRTARDRRQRDVAVRDATPADADRITHVLAAAMANTPLARWLMLTPATLYRYGTPYLSVITGYALDRGLVHVSTGLRGHLTGAALWFPRTEALPEPADFHPRLAAACGPTIGRVRALHALLDDHHPTDAHHHLALHAVLPQLRRHGIGTALLAHHHRWLDNAAIRAYTVATSPSVFAHYTRHGYQHHQSIHLDDHLYLYAMWREPNAQPRLGEDPPAWTPAQPGSYPGRTRP